MTFFHWCFSSFLNCTNGIKSRKGSRGVLNKRKIMKAFITSQFSYCPLVWMFHRKRPGKKKKKCITWEGFKNHIRGKTSSFNEQLEKDNSASFNYKNLQALATEMYKVSNNMSSTILNAIFAPTPYNLHNPVSLKYLKSTRSTMVPKFYWKYTEA